MIQRKKSKNYSKRVKRVQGAGFMDIVKSFGSYIVQNKDLIAKPVLAATGELGGYALNKGGKAIMDKVLAMGNKSKVANKSGKTPMDKILAMASKTENIIGSGIKKF